MLTTLTKSLSQKHLMRCCKIHLCCHKVLMTNFDQVKFKLVVVHFIYMLSDTHSCFLLHFHIPTKSDFCCHPFVTPRRWRHLCLLQNGAYNLMQKYSFRCLPWWWHLQVAPSMPYTRSGDVLWPAVMSIVTSPHDMLIQAYIIMIVAYQWLISKGM